MSLKGRNWRTEDFDKAMKTLAGVWETEDRISPPLELVRRLSETLCYKRTKEALLLYYGLGGEPRMSIKEIAERCGVSRNCIQQNLALARRQMRHPRRANLLRRSIRTHITDPRVTPLEIDIFGQTVEEYEKERGLR